MLDQNTANTEKVHISASKLNKKSYVEKRLENESIMLKVEKNFLHEIDRNYKMRTDKFQGQ